MKTTINWRPYPEQKPGFLQDGLTTHVLTHADIEHPWVGLAVWNMQQSQFTTTSNRPVPNGSITHFALREDITTEEA